MVDYLEYETVLLGTMLENKNAAIEVLDMLTPAMFIVPSHKELFRRIEMFCQTELALDSATLATTFEDEGAFVKGLSPDLIDSVRARHGSHLNASYYAEIVRNGAMVRTVGQWASKQPETVAELAEKVDKFRNVANFIKGKLPKLQTFDNYNDEQLHQGIATGFGLIDNNTETHGLPKGQMTVIAAYAKGGKTASMVQLADSISQAQQHIVYGTFADLNMIGIGQRRLRNYCGWSRRPKSAAFSADYESAVRKLRGNGYFNVFDGTQTRPTVEAFLSRLKRLPSMPAAVFVDYAQELTTTVKVRNDLDRHDAVSKALTVFAGEFDLPVVVGSQISEGRDGAKDITKGSRVWEERAGLVLKLSVCDESARKKLKDQQYNVDGITKASIPFNRFGRSVEGWWQFDYSRVMFVEL